MAPFLYMSLRGSVREPWQSHKEDLPISIQNNQTRQVSSYLSGFFSLPLKGKAIYTNASNSSNPHAIASVLCASEDRTNRPPFSRIYSRISSLG